MIFPLPTGSDSTELICSAKGCRSRAAHALIWNNPKIHEADRRKVWLACSLHRDGLSAFLDLRGFLREVISVDDLGAQDG